MALKLKKIKKRNPLNQTQSKWYLTLEKTGNVGIRAIAKEVEGRSALSLGDVQSVLSNMVEILPVFLKLGQAVNLEGFGSFRLSISSDGVDRPEELNAHHVKSVRLLFLPSTELKRNLEGISFEIEGATPAPTEA